MASFRFAAARGPIVVLLALLIAASAACRRAARPLSSSRHNLLLVTIDTLRADRVGCYGDGQASTATLDALAAEGWKFDPVLTPVPITLPAHATLLTGEEPPGHGLRSNGAFTLLPDQETLAERLKAEGYETAAFVGAFPLDRRFGLAQGFDVYGDRTEESPGGFHFRERRAEAVIDSAVRWLAGARRLPLFMWVHLYDPHDPYDPPPAFRERFASDLYRAEIAYTDAALARLFDHVRRAGLWDDTVLIAASDHGEGLGDHGEETHGLFIYESTTRVPLIVKPAGGARLRAAPWQVDRLSGVMALALQLTGVRDAPARTRLPKMPPYLESLAPELDYNWAPLFALREERWKYIDAPIAELYDLSSDPRETRNLAAEAAAAGTVERLRANLEAAKRQLERGTTDRARSAPSPETVEALKSLGYASGTAARSAGDARARAPDHQRRDPTARGGAEQGAPSA
ncbi:MAG: sulfatase [Acidobacteria bacterium]|nr:sulfatase [Acidobacteriota bacterium]